jgi:hypothetical protein
MLTIRLANFRSVILCIISYLLAGGAFYRYRYSLGYAPLQVMGLGLLCTCYCRIK